MKAEGKKGPVDIIFLIVQRNALQDAISIIYRFNPKAFYSIEDVRSLNVGNSKFTTLHLYPDGGGKEGEHSNC